MNGNEIYFFAHQPLTEVLDRHDTDKDHSIDEEEFGKICTELKEVANLEAIKTRVNGLMAGSNY